jgi:hypothetical protein
MLDLCKYLTGTGTSMGHKSCVNFITQWNGGESYTTFVAGATVSLYVTTHLTTNFVSVTCEDQIVFNHSFISFHGI